MTADIVNMGEFKQRMVLSIPPQPQPRTEGFRPPIHYLCQSCGAHTPTAVVLGNGPKCASCGATGKVDGRPVVIAVYADEAPAAAPVLPGAYTCALPPDGCAYAFTLTSADAAHTTSVKCPRCHGVKVTPTL